jgi:hypothetical protein
MSGADVVDALVQTMCEDCPHHEECLDRDDQEDVQLIACLYHMYRTHIEYKYPEKLEEV